MASYDYRCRNCGNVFTVRATFKEKEAGLDEEGYEQEEGATEEGTTTFERIPVVKGTSDIGYSEITLLKDIPANAKIVTKGAFFVLGKMTNAGEGHAH